MRSNIQVLQRFQTDKLRAKQSFVFQLLTIENARQLHHWHVFCLEYIGRFNRVHPLHSTSIFGSIIMKTLTITDLTIKQVPAHTETQCVRALSREEMHRVHGGRAVAVLVDGRPGGGVDDFQLNMEIFKGNIGVKVV